jgi:dTDP-4-amino-4,6-dideoxygalactose transaminase
MIPLVDLKIQYRSIRGEITSGLLEALEETRFILGPNVSAFEQETAAYLGVEYAVAVASGTDALHLALVAAGIRDGDEVITSPFTFIATAEAIRHAGATPVFVDVDPRTFNLDPANLEAAVTTKTRAVLPVHLFGQPADMAAIGAVCRKHGLLLIEDCAQSFGAAVGGRMTGAIGDLGCFSFFPTKNLGCYGDGGMVTTRSPDLAERVNVLRNHGSRERYRHSVIGFNSRLDELQAVVLRVKLKRIATYNEGRRRVARLYGAMLEGSGVAPPVEDGKGTHVYHQYTVLTDRRGDIVKALASRDIASEIYYPIPLHRQEVFAESHRGISFPVAEETAARCLSLPIFPEMTGEQVREVTDAIRSS